ncbi:MAG: hypothetical protein HLUCCO16_01540 [Phormidium sp. OSCR]|nr:MAG: hypothetical protein HLUCCO16_01540 [Phormidium sp. OSCR]
MHPNSIPGFDFLSFPIFSPQGDGNKWRTIHTADKAAKGSLSLSFPRKGTETRVITLYGFEVTLIVFPYLFPARGRKHPGQAVEPAGVIVFPYLFPARGRKHFLFGCVEEIILVRLSLSFPRKGTETPIRVNGLQTISPSFPIFSPQGDGNIG